MALSTKLFSLVVFLVLLAPSLSDIQVPKEIFATLSLAKASSVVTDTTARKPAVVVARITDSYQRMPITSDPFQDGRVH